MTPLTPQQAALVDTARLIAHSAHAGDRWGPHPYVTHLSRVVDVLQETYPEDASLHAAGWLHDTLEDTAHTTETLYEALHAAGAPWGADATQDVLSLVAAVTKPAGLSRKQSRAYHHATVTFGGPRAVALKVADRLVNMRGSGSARDARLYRMYQQEHHAFRHTLRDPLGSPRLEVLWGALDAEFERERVR
jgi:guanosine-3',5'-bis(diphosphate) 3'-pyrophosphohydrolase